LLFYGAVWYNFFTLRMGRTNRGFFPGRGQRLPGGF